MLLKTVEYARPSTVGEALELLTDRDGSAPLAGGQSLVNVLKNRVASVELLVDISALEELRAINREVDGSLEIGACVTYDELDRSPEVRAGHGIVADVASHIEDQQIRNRGTIGGNCCLSDPTNNLPPLLVALDATMHIASREATRSVPAGEFFKGYFYTALEPGELLTSISIPALGDHAGAGYESLNVAADAKTIVRSAAFVRAHATIEEIRVVLARIGPIPIRFEAMEAALVGCATDEAAVAAAVEPVATDFDPISDTHGSSQYRREVAKVIALRAVNKAIEEAGR
ncbi:MAG: FAD binding domain-containing protein [Acidimicrobiales bacterium]